MAAEAGGAATADGGAGWRPGLEPEEERRLTRRLGNPAYSYDWRPTVCGTKLAEVLEDETGRRWAQVSCRTCTRRYGERRYHYLRLGRR